MISKSGVTIIMLSKYCRKWIFLFILLCPFQIIAEYKSYSCQRVFKDFKDRLFWKIKKKKYKPADTSNIPSNIDFNQISSLQNFIPPHEANIVAHKKNWFKTGELYGEKVFLKIIAINKHVKELANIHALNSLGIPTLFIGVTRDKEGQLYMVSRFQEGAFVRIIPHKSPLLSGFDSSYQITENTYRQLRNLRDMFIKNNIYPSDFQFLVSKKGEIHLIDFEYYRIFKKFNPLFLLFIYKPYVKFEKARQAVGLPFLETQ